MCVISLSRKKKKKKNSMCEDMSVSLCFLSKRVPVYMVRVSFCICSSMWILRVFKILFFYYYLRTLICQYKCVFVISCIYMRECIWYCCMSKMISVCVFCKNNAVVCVCVQDAVEFPAVSICNLNILRNSKFEKDAFLQVVMRGAPFCESRFLMFFKLISTDNVLLPKIFTVFS